MHVRGRSFEAPLLFKDSPSSSQSTQFLKVCTLPSSTITFSIFLTAFPAPISSSNFAPLIRAPHAPYPPWFLLFPPPSAWTWPGSAPPRTGPRPFESSIPSFLTPPQSKTYGSCFDSLFISFIHHFSQCSLCMYICLFLTPDLVPILAFSNRAFCYGKLELHKHVIKDCDRALQLDPTLLQAYILKGSLIFLSNLIPLSISFFPLRLFFYLIKFMLFLPILIASYLELVFELVRFE